MPRIGNYFLFLILLGWCCAGIATNSLAQVQVRAQLSETNPYRGERVGLVIEISGESFRNIELPQLPELTGLQYLSTSPATGHRVQIVNGVTSRQYTYTYYLQPTELGKQTVPPITVVIDGTAHKTAAIDLTVLDRSAAASRADADSRDDLFLRIEVSDRSPFVNQQVIANVVLYFKQGIDIPSYQPSPSWKAEGFWKEELSDGLEARVESVVLNGVRYRKARLVQYALFPSKTGRLTISPFSAICTVRMPPSANSPFAGWGGFGSTQRTIELESDAINLNVRELPAGAVGSSIGVVGQFDVKRSITKQNLLVGESFEVVTEISGQGNIALASKPEYEFPDGFEVYQPQIQMNVNRSGSRINGNKSIRDVLTVRRPGTFTIPETTVSWYNDRTSSWQRKVLPAITLNVERDPNAVTVAAAEPTGGMVILTGLLVGMEQERMLIGKPWFWILLFSPVLLFAVGLFWTRHQERMSTDTLFARSKTAAKNAEIAFKEAQNAANSGRIKDGYGHIHRGLAGFIGDRLSLPAAGVDDEVYVRALRNTEVDGAVTDQIEELLKTCSMIRYAPVTDQRVFDADLKSARERIQQLRKWI